MKQILIFVGFILLALTGCGGSSQNTATSAEGVNTNANVTETAPVVATDANASLAEGNRLLDENQTEAAITVLKQAIVLDPNLAEAHFKLGIAYDLFEMQMEQSGIVDETAKSNSKESRKKSNSERAFEKAVESYRKWLKNNPKDDVAHFNLGRTYAKLTQDEDAEEAFREAIKLKPDDTEYQTELGAILIKLAQYREAITPLKKAIELDKGNGRAIDLLEDAEAGRQRVDYVSAKNSNQTEPNKNVKSRPNSNTSSNSNSNSNSEPKRPEGNSKSKTAEPEMKSKKGDLKDARPRVVPIKPN